MKENTMKIEDYQRRIRRLNLISIASILIIFFLILSFTIIFLIALRQELDFENKIDYYRLGFMGFCDVSNKRADIIYEMKTELENLRHMSLKDFPPVEKINCQELYIG